MLPNACAGLMCAALAAFAMAPPLGAEEGLARVQGVVTVDGVPLREGKLALHADGARPIEIPIKEGKYTADKVPAGKKIVTVKGAGVPTKYGSPDTSGLIVEIETGANELDFDLKS